MRAVVVIEGGPHLLGRDGPLGAVVAEQAQSDLAHPRQVLCRVLVPRPASVVRSIPDTRACSRANRGVRVIAHAAEPRPMMATSL